MRQWVIIGILVSVMCAAAYVYFTYTQNTINDLVEEKSTLEENLSSLEIANNENLNTIESMNESYAEIRRNFDSLERDFKDISSKNNELLERLSKHDIGALAYSKPNLVENIVNNASSKALRCFEIMSGAPLTNKERNASNAKEFNSECPWLFGTVD